jgi:hypothetical protein
MALRRQKIERAAKARKRVPEKKIQPGRLLTIAGITREMVRVYCLARSGELEPQTAGTLCRILERIKYTVAAGPLEQRLDALEASVAERVKGTPGRANDGGRFEVDDLYDDGDRDERSEVH